MIIKVLGAAAGGGFPQWNCNCGNCHKLRLRNATHQRQMNDALAISDVGKEWFLINATPDICAQIEAHTALHPGPNLRNTPIKGILLTDAELDHTIGLLSLRQNAELDIYATTPVIAALAHDFPIQKMLEPYAQLRWQDVGLWESFPLFKGRLVVTVIPLGSKSPRYTSLRKDHNEESLSRSWVIGYRIMDQVTGGVVVYAPGVESWTRDLENAIENTDCIFFDGTFWDEEELMSLGASRLTATHMGHMPIAGAQGSLRKLLSINAARKVYVHINNTNPILDHASKEYQTLMELGIEVGYDGLELEV